MIAVQDARAALLALTRPLEIETVPLRDAVGRVLALPQQARRDQPPFDASSMDGYALRSAELERHAMFKIIGEAAAGHGFSGHVGPGQAVRIFTGAPLPDGADCVVIQEDTDRRGDLLTITDEPGSARNVRPRGGDFTIGQEVGAPRRLRARDIALLAAMNIAELPVRRRPVVALMSTGDELVMPGETPGPDQIIVSNTFGLKALLEQQGAEVRMLPIARDTESSLRTAFGLAAGADLLITIGGASVGDHDLVGPVAESLGMARSFYKVAMRPGKPLMAGKLGEMAMIGLPGNPVSALVCGHVFVLPVIDAFLGLPAIAPPLHKARLLRDLPPNGPREHYMRATLCPSGIDPFGSQDSSLLTILAQADALLVRPPHDPARDAGDEVSYLPF